MSDNPKSYTLLSQQEELYRGWDDYYGEDGDAAWGDCSPPFVQPALNEYLKEGHSVVDFGAGDGRNSMGLAQAGVRVTLVDISAAGLARAAKRARHLGLKPIPTLVTASFEQLPLASNQFDLALCVDALPQVHRPRVALEEMARTLVAGGTLITNIFTPRDAAFGEGERLTSSSFLFKNTLFSFWEEDQFRPLLQGLFDVVGCRHVRWDDPPHIPFRPYAHTHDALVFILRKP